MLEKTWEPLRVSNWPDENKIVEIKLDDDCEYRAIRVGGIFVVESPNGKRFVENIRRVRKIRRTE